MKEIFEMSNKDFYSALGYGWVFAVVIAPLLFGW